MSVVHAVVVGLLSLLVVTFFSRQIVDQLRSGKVRPRDSSIYKMREDNPLWYWFSIGSQIAVILIILYIFLWVS
jgi:hypothetical protein